MMKLVRSVLAALFLTGLLFGSPVAAKTMDETDVTGSYYAAEMMDAEGTFSTSFSRLTADGDGTISYEALFPESDTSETGTVPYKVDDEGFFSIKESADITLSFGAAKGAVSSDGNYLMLGDMVSTDKGGEPSLLFAIKQSTGLDQNAMDGEYNLFLFYTAPLEAGGSFIDTNAGTFAADINLQQEAADGTLSGTFGVANIHFVEPTQPQPISGDYEIDYTVQEDGRLTLTLASGNSIESFSSFEGAISGDGNVFVAVETSQEDGNQAFVIGVRQRTEDLTLADIEGSYYVDDFGYYPFDIDEERNDAAGFLMDLAFGAGGTFNFTEIDTTCPSCTINIDPRLDGTLEVSPSGNQYTYTISNYPEGRKPGGQINLSPNGTVLTMLSPLYLGIGIEQADGVPDAGDPVAKAGADRTTVAPGETVTLDATGSTDENGTIESYRWQAVAGDAGVADVIELSDDTNPQPTFTAPNAGGTVTFRLTVTDNENNTDVDTVTITVEGDPIPTADAGEDRSVDEDTVVTLNGSASTAAGDGEITSWSWTYTGDREDVTLENANTATPNFVAPMVDQATELTFELTVEDTEGATATDSVTITVTDTDGSGGNQPPTADAGKDKIVSVDATVTLDGSASSDDGSMTYAWTQTVDGPQVVLTDADKAKATFTAPSVDEPTELTFELTVTDELNQTDTDTVVITVDNDINENGLPDAMEDRDSENDMDADGTPDFDDTDSVRFRHVNAGDDANGFIGIYTSAGTLVEVNNLDDLDEGVSQVGRPAGLSTPYGVFSYTITGLNPGDEVTVTFMLPNDLPENARFYKIDDTSWQQVDVTPGETADTFTITLTDGGALDADNQADGTIVDPSTIAVLEADDDDDVIIDDDDDDDDSCFIRSLFR